MPDAAIGSDPPLDGKALGALRDAVVDAFTADELFEVALVDIDENLYVTYGARETPLDALALAFLTGLRARGLVTRFCRSARKRRPLKAQLIAAITLHCPQAMTDEAPASGEVRQLVDALDLMQRRLADPDVASAVNASKGDFGSLATQLARLRTYKGLHDTLQDFQVGQFSSLGDCVRRLRTDPGASVVLRDLITGLLRTFGNARSELQPLEAAQDDVEEKSCIDEFLGAFKEVSEARDRLDDRAARIALKKLRGLLQSHPSRINGALRTEARRLPLGRLCDAILAAAEAAALSPDQRAALRNGAQSVADLRLRLARNVTNHDRWQGVERYLWLLDETADRGDGAIDDFRDYWDIAKESVTPLWQADVQAAWVVATRRNADAIDVALAAVPADGAVARSNYGDFRHAAMWHFYDVDRELRALCEDVVQIGEPVAALVKGGG